MPFASLISWVMPAANSFLNLLQNRLYSEHLAVLKLVVNTENPFL